MSRPLDVRWLGMMRYVEAWDLQRELASARRTGSAPDTLLLLEHPHVYTLGRTSREEHILVSPEFLSAKNATIERIDRGGEVTYHGPGQLVAYPIMLLEGQEKHLDRLVWNLEQCIIQTLAHLWDYGPTLCRAARSVVKRQQDCVDWHDGAPLDCDTWSGA